MTSPSALKYQTECHKSSTGKIILFCWLQAVAAWFSGLLPNPWIHQHLVVNFEFLTMVSSVNSKLNPSHALQWFHLSGLLLCHKCIMGTAPVYLEELLHVKQPSRTIRSLDGLLLVQPRGRLVTFRDRDFCWINFQPTCGNWPAPLFFAGHLKTYHCASARYLVKLFVEPGTLKTFMIFWEKLRKKIIRVWYEYTYHTVGILRQSFQRQKGVVWLDHHVAYLILVRKDWIRLD